MAQMSLSTPRSKVPHMYYSAALESQISVYFALRLITSKVMQILTFSLASKLKFQSLFNFVFLTCYGR